MINRYQLAADGCWNTGLMVAFSRIQLNSSLTVDFEFLRTKGTVAFNIQNDKNCAKFCFIRKVKRNILLFFRMMSSGTMDMSRRMGGKRYIPHRFWEQAIFYELATIPLSARHVASALFVNHSHFAR